MSTTYTIEGMTCGHCVARVETALRAVTGVTAASVSLTPPRAVIEGTNVDISTLAAALADTSFTISAMPALTQNKPLPR